ncbi:MAG: ABC transporter ATP-binding protein [Gemmataceae bacterium]|nr:ABC transporter ATP-binding protein [Gemmataceae bacterium]
MSITVEGYHKSYGETVAVSGVSFAVAPGEILGLLGPNGAGKTTTLRALAGILRPTRGRLLLDGHDIARDPVAAKMALAYVPDDPQLFDRLTVWEHFKFIAATYRQAAWEPRGEMLLARLELGEKRDVPAADLSRGMRQKLAMACGWLHRPRAVLLDEPFTGPDPRGIRTMKELIRELAAEGAAIIVSSHLLTLFEDLVTTVLIMHRGRVLRHGPLSSLREEIAAQGRHETLEEMFFRLTEAPSPVTADPNPPSPITTDPKG